MASNCYDPWFTQLQPIFLRTQSSGSSRCRSAKSLIILKQMTLLKYWSSSSIEKAASLNEKTRSTLLSISRSLLTAILKSNTLYRVYNKKVPNSESYWKTTKPKKIQRWKLFRNSSKTGQMWGGQAVSLALKVKTQTMYWLVPVSKNGRLMVGNVYTGQETCARKWNASWTSPDRKVHRNSFSLIRSIRRF